MEVINVQYQQMDEYLLVTTRGEYDVNFIEVQIPTLIDEAQTAKRTRILIDAMDIAPPKTEVDRFLVGQAFAALAPYRVAVVYPRQWINKLTENTAVNRGLTFLVSGDKEEALRWLLADLPKLRGSQDAWREPQGRPVES
jgi:hypothetical protein